MTNNTPDRSEAHVLARRAADADKSDPFVYDRVYSRYTNGTLDCFREMEHLTVSEKTLKLLKL
jgi:hypothetical protein